MEYIVVTGMTHAGKSTWIEKEYGVDHPGVKIIDSYHIQSMMTEGDAIDIYGRLLDASDAAVQVCAGHKVTVIIEGVLLKTEDRKFFLDSFRKYAKPGDTCTLVWCEASEKDIMDRLRYDLVPDADSEYQDGCDLSEKPSGNEGFDRLIIYWSEGSDPNIKVNLARYHCGYTGNDSAEAARMMLEFENCMSKNYRFGDAWVSNIKKSARKN